MDEILTHIEIDAGAHDVWRVLTDLRAYPEWNSMMSPEGDVLEPGARLHVRVRMGKWLRFTFRPTIRRADYEREFSWRGRLPARLLQGVHTFSIEPLADQRVRFVHREVFTGWLVPLYMWLMGGWATRAYSKMNRELKARAELVCAQACRGTRLVTAEPPTLTPN
ncbi:MAG: SRPBCC family protein [Deltaproteobacteria bacterium]